MSAMEVPATNPEASAAWRSSRLASARVSLKQRAPLVVSVVYVAALGVWAEGAPSPKRLLIGGLAIVVVLVSGGRAHHLERALGWGLALVVASLGAGSGHHGLDACGAIGAMTCAAGAAMAIARIPATGGIVQTQARSPAVSVFVVAVAWWAALVARLAPDTGPLGWVAENPEAWEIGAVGTSALVLFAATDWTLRRRRLELGVEERAQAMRGILAACLVAAVLAGFVDEAQAAPIGRAFAAGVASFLGAAALHPDPVRVARLTRRAIALASVGGAVAWLFASVAENSFGGGWAATFATALAALSIGAAWPVFERPLRPAGGAWLDAFARASALASQADPETAIRESLVALRAPGGSGSPSPELWTLPTGCVATVDAAGYLHERQGELPEGLALVAAAEPEATLRADLLDSLEVRRPDLRPFSKWLSARGAWLATLIASEGEVEGVLVLPRMGRDRAATLEEVRALKVVADRLASPCRARAMQARMLVRGQEMLLRVEAAEAKVDRLSHERGLEAGRDTTAAARLAGEGSAGVYAASSRLALEALERRAAVGAPIAVLAPSGVDAVPYLARAHLSGARREGPLVIVDATSTLEHDSDRWRDARRSPLALAQRGTLVLLDGAGLPAEIQRLVARALAEKRAPWERPEPLDVHFVFTAVASPDELVARGRLDALLALRLGDARSAPVVLPRLRERPEDLRAIFNERLAREGLRVHGRPVGIEHSAYARFVDHPFPGEDAELAVIVRRLVAHCTGDVVRVTDVETLLSAFSARSPTRSPVKTVDGGRPAASGSAPAGERGGRNKASRRGLEDRGGKGSGPTA